MAGTLAWFDLTYGGVLLYYSGIPVVLRAPQESQNREAAFVLEIDADRCANTFGVAPCTATGVECYNTFSTCKDTPNFIKTIHTYKFCSRGMLAPVGELLRPYITSISTAPTQIKPGEGLALRSQTKLTLIDETDNDAEQDPYVANRAAVAQGTFWRRFQARNLYIAGRFARLKRGFIVDPFTWNDFTSELYIIDSIRGPDSSGNMSVVLSDVLKLADRATLPLATNGKLSAAFKDVTHAGLVTSGTTTNVVLDSGASPTDGDYIGQELKFTNATGAGQSRVITAYDGNTRTATVSALLVAPDSTSSFEISPLSINVGLGRGSQYGTSGYVRINDEVIQFTSVSGDVLSWPDSTYRGQFNTERDDHNADANVQLCKAWFGTSAEDVLIDILDAAGIASTYIDMTGLAQAATDWMIAANIYACITSPEKCSDLLKELSQDLNLMLWWDPAGQKVMGKVNVPEIDSSVVVSITDDDIMQADLNRLEDQRITEAAQYYDLRTATSNTREDKNFDRGEIRIDTDARSTNQYGDVRPDVRMSRWLSEHNEAHASALVARRVVYYRDAPFLIRFRVDPRTRLNPGDLIDLTTRHLTDTEGVAAEKRCRVTKIDDRLADKDIEVATTTFAGKRWSFIAPNAAPDFGSATAADKVYAYISNSSGLMADGTDGYRVI